MRIAFVFAIAMAGCGGEGKCERPPCAIPAIACSSDRDCFQSEFCDFQNNSCGRSADDMGACTPRPSVCDAELQPTCGCDGKFHDNPCLASSEGTDRSAAGGCSVPPGLFTCGDTACDRETQMCVDFFSGDSHFFQCQSLPPECRNDKTCDCVPQFGCDACKESPGLTLSCMISPEG